MNDVDDCPGHAGWAIENREHSDPWKEEDQDIRRPNTRVREPLGIAVQIRRRHRRHVHLMAFSDFYRVKFDSLIMSLSLFCGFELDFWVIWKK